MKHILHFSICITIILTGCSRKDAAPDNTKQVYDQLHGRYRAISSTSKDMVDVNLDGTASTDIISEIPALAEPYSNMEIRVISKDYFLLSDFWPVQYLGYGTVISVNYVNQGVVRPFTLAANSNEMLVKPDTDYIPDPDKFPFPTSISIEGPDLIKIVVDRKIYTSRGWITTTITTVYKRFTMET